MNDNAARIEQFRKMAEADPENELGHFSLGRALLDANQLEDAIKSFRRVIELNPNIGKVYQLMADALLRQNKRDAAIETLQTGVRIAHARGDLMPQNDMSRMLKDLGAAVPELKGAEADKPVGQGEVLCAAAAGSSRKCWPAVQQRAGQVDLRKDLQRLLAGMDRDGDEGHQRASPAALRSAGAEDL